MERSHPGGPWIFTVGCVRATGRTHPHSTVKIRILATSLPPTTNVFQPTALPLEVVAVFSSCHKAMPDAAQHASCCI